MAGQGSAVGVRRYCFEGSRQQQLHTLTAIEPLCVSINNATAFETVSMHRSPLFLKRDFSGR